MFEKIMRAIGTLAVIAGLVLLANGATKLGTLKSEPHRPALRSDQSKVRHITWVEVSGHHLAVFELEGYPVVLNTTSGDISFFPSGASLTCETAEEQP